MIKAFVRTVLAALGYEVRPLRRGKPSPIHLWEEHLEFNDRYEQIVGHTVVSKQRCFILYQFAKHVASVPGDVAEVGVYKGGTAKLLATTLGNTAKSVHLFDTFTGMPATDPKKDWHKAGVFGDTSLESVAGYLRDCGNTHLHAGFFPDTAQVVEKETFCFVHVDCDIYLSVKDCCEFFYPRLAEGGIMVFDDYGDLSCPGAKMAVDEFLADKQENPCYLPTGQCFCVKL